MVDEGFISEWNEGTMKMIRLHDIQNHINIYKVKPRSRTDGDFNYEWWYRMVVSLRDEGDSKYTPTEVKACNRYEKIIDTLIKDKQLYTIDGIKGAQYRFNQDKYDYLLALIKQYELYVKKLNDEHGLTTMNQKNKGFFR